MLSILSQQLQLRLGGSTAVWRAKQTQKELCTTKQYSQDTEQSTVLWARITMFAEQRFWVFEMAHQLPWTLA